MSVGYAEAGDLLERLTRAYETFDGDRAVAAFSDDAEYHEDPYRPALVGHNAIRAEWLAMAAARDRVELTIERHLVSGDTIVAIWHLSYVLREDGRRRRASGVWVLDIGDGRIRRLRAWWRERPTGTVGGEPAAD